MPLSDAMPWYTEQAEYFGGYASMWMRLTADHRQSDNLRDRAPEWALQAARRAAHFGRVALDAKWRTAHV